MENINKRRIERLVEKVRQELWVIRGRKIAVFGLAFKPNTDDVRFAPAIELIRALVRDGAKVSAYDPQATEKARTVLPDIQYCSSPYEAAQEAEAIIITTEWEEFRKLDWDELKKLVTRPLVVDGRNMFQPGEMTCRGFHYISTGRQPESSTDNGVSITPPQELHAVLK